MFELSFLTNAFKNLKSTLDDTVDRLNHLFTCALLLIFSILIGSKQNFGSPLHCISPTEYPDKWEGYINNYCFVSNTYISKDNIQVTPDFDLTADKKININYYQWVPFIFAIQALLFYLPHYLWMILQQWSNSDFKYVVEKCKKVSDEKPEVREQTITTIAKHIEVIVKSRSGRGRLNGMGSWGAFAYLLSKMMNIGNLILQIYFINIFIGDKRLDWGIELWNNLINGVYWHQSGFFPLNSFCDIKINKLGGRQDYTIQCVLMVNIINEKLFLILYYWFIALLVLTVGNFLYSVFLVTGAGQGRLSRSLFKNCGSDIHVQVFMASFLGTDGALLFRFIQNEAGSITAYELASTLYRLEVDSLGLKHKQGEMVKRAVISQSKERLLDTAFSYA